MEKDKNRKLKPETILLHGGYSPDSALGSRAVPIYQTTSYMFKDTEHAARLFSLEEFGNIYTRLTNPTTDVLEKRIAMFEGAAEALAVSSGQAAITIALLNIAQSSDEIISSNNLYGGTYTLFNYTFAKMGIKVRFVDLEDLTAVSKSINSKTKAIYTESIANPKLNIADLESLSKIAHENDIPLIVDNTVVPYLLKPVDYGADVIVYSATKFLGGHGTSMAGLIVDSGNFNWANGKFPLISGSDSAYHGLDFVEKFGKSAYIIKARLNLLRDLGPSISPFNSFLLLQGLETLHLRMPRHVENALAVAEYLQKHENVEWVNYPSLKSSPEAQKASKYFKKGAGAIIGFGIKGGISAGKKFINSLNLISHLANIGDAKTLAIHPATTTHQQLSEEERLKAGVTSDYIRLSVGIENVDDIISDLKQALEKTVL